MIFFEEIVGGVGIDEVGDVVFLNEDVFEKGVWGFDFNGFVGFEVGEGILFFFLREFFFLGIFGGILKFLGLFVLLDEIFGGDNSLLEMFFLLLVILILLLVGIWM